MTTADIYSCHCRWVLGQPEFLPILEKHSQNESVQGFEAYYKNMRERYFGSYFSTRFGSAGDPNAAETKQIAAKENVKFPFEW